uniref:Uncharacterized protein n=1 Tax=Glossina brevipalpis TaxID=37001 RepID=A0A1A9W0F0_9MUSC
MKSIPVWTALNEKLLLLPILPTRLCLSLLLMLMLFRDTYYRPFLNTNNEQWNDCLLNTNTVLKPLKYQYALSTCPMVQSHGLKFHLDLLSLGFKLLLDTNKPDSIQLKILWSMSGKRNNNINSSEFQNEFVKLRIFNALIGFLNMTQ